MITILDKQTYKPITDGDVLMRLAGLDVGMGYEGVAIQDDGTPIVCDRCGNFGYLDLGKYRAIITVDGD